MSTFAQALHADPTLATWLASAEDARVIKAHAGSCVEVMDAICTRYADRPCLGERVGTGPGEAVTFRTITYREVWARAAALASAWSHLGIVARGACVGILGFASTDWLIADLACIYAEAVTVPLPGGAPVEALRHIIREAELVCVVVSEVDHARLREVLVGCPSVRTVIVMDTGPAVRSDAPTIGELEILGRARGLVAPSRPTEPTRLTCIMYTSGSSGLPKGVMLRDRHWAEFIAESVKVNTPLVTVGYLPLCHMIGRGFVVQTTMASGGLINFTGARDLSTLFEDIQHTRPTMLALVPRVSWMIYQHYKTELVRARVDAAPPHERAARTQQVLASVGARFLGDRLCGAMTSGAPTAPEVLEFLERCFRVQVMNHYGSTEIGPIAANGRIHDNLSFRLVDVSELGYRTTDTPFPRGELLISSPRVGPRYYKNQQANAAIGTADGFLRTGDIVELRGPRQIAVIDRRDNILKLAHGEFVSIARLEEQFLSSPFLAQVYLHGDSRQAYLLAVLVINQAAIEVELGASADPDTIKRLLRAELGRAAQRQGLQPHEIPRDFIVETRPFTVENQLLTEANKPRRPGLRAAYGPQLDAMYAAIELRQDSTATAGEGSLDDLVLDAVAVALGLPRADIASDRSFVALGGDSLGAVALASRLEAQLGVDLSAGDILASTATIASVTARVRSLAASAPRQVTFVDLHGAAPRGIPASDLVCTRFLPGAMLTVAPSEPRSPRTILLTGATGFLGRVALLELLERGAVVHCLVRAADAAAAAARLRTTLSPMLAARIDAAPGRLVVHAGDVARPNLGLPDAAHAQLADEIEAVMHSAALVNHALSYAQLFQANVVGTMEVARFALTGRRKPISFVSSIAAVAGSDRMAPLRERDELAALIPSRALGDGPADVAVGYGTSKWACELLLRDLHARTSLPIAVFRCSMLLPHRTLPEVNHEDLFIRLLRGIQWTRLAPRSFAATARAPHYDGVAVDDAAAAIAAIALAGTPGFATYHVSNDHWHDGVSLDRLVEWAAATWNVARIDDYADWRRRFGAQLETLPAADRRLSPLPIIQRWDHPQGGRPLILDTRELRRAMVAHRGVPCLPVLDADYLRRVATLLT